MRTTLASLGLAFGAGVTLAPAALCMQGWKTPPEEVRRIAEAAPTPAVNLSPDRRTMLVVEQVALPPLADMAAPMLRLAGARLNPMTNGRHGPRRYSSFQIQDVETGESRPISLPADSNLSMPSWSPNGERFAFTCTTSEGIELWIGSVAEASARRRTAPVLNGMAPGVSWLGDDSLLCFFVEKDRGAAPQRPAVPAGPVIQESAGVTGPVRTYQDLLRDEHDAALFDYYFRASPMALSVDGSEQRTLGPTAVYRGVSPSPDGSHYLVSTLRRPYSYLHPSSAFPTRTEVWNAEGAPVAVLRDRPLRDNVPIGGVETGPRGHAWRLDQPAALTWVEALDGGDPKAEAPHRDQLMTLAAPFSGEASTVARLEHRSAGLSYLENGACLLAEFDRDRRWSRTWMLELDQSAQTLRLVFDRSTQDYYGDPGRPVRRRGEDGRSRVMVHEGAIYLTGSGSSPEGDRPFLDRMSLADGSTERLWQCEEGFYESVVGLVSADGARFIVRRESKTDPPNYHLLADGAEPRALTRFPDPFPELRDIRKELVHYERDDGLPLSATLYLPPDYAEGERRPMMVWAYPREYNDLKNAGQVRGSPHRFTRIGGSSHLFLLMQGYVVMDAAAMPVVGDVETANDTFVEQIVAAARAAIDEADRRGVADPARVGVGGHSYGAFMTANLLAHSDLFRAGVARSGAYNRTLTPFGFQNERRTFWEAPMTYFAMSPFMHAPKIDEPLLMIHGQRDNNSGTFPIQSERMYHAIKGHGGKARLVMLPYESHGYRGRESVLHVLAEMIEWFDQYVAGSEPAG